jgi:D-serine dehydratase
MNALNINENALLKDLRQLKEVIWINPHYDSNHKEIDGLAYTNILDAEARLQRFAPFFKTVFPDTLQSKGIIESDLIPVPNFTNTYFHESHTGSIYIKGDHALPVAGSIKARGGIYEVIKHAETLAIQAELLSVDDDYTCLANPSFKAFFSQYGITVGSTGNLGLSIGIISAELGFHVTVHMSSDAKTWKKNLLRSKGVNVVEHNTDYSLAVEQGRKEASKDPNNYFIDDENSANLFLGYSVAALRLREQFKAAEIKVDHEHPLFVYLPCGVGGGPGGVTYGLKQVFGANVHCFFAEPTHSPCMLLGMSTGLHDGICVQDIGIDNITEADGLAVGRPSSFVGKSLMTLLSGITTSDDKELFRALTQLADTEGLYLEPSALAGATALKSLLESDYFSNFSSSQIENSTHILWATGGSFVPKDIMDSYYQTGKNL